MPDDRVIPDTWPGVFYPVPTLGPPRLYAVAHFHPAWVAAVARDTLGGRERGARAHAWLTQPDGRMAWAEVIHSWGPETAAGAGSHLEMRWRELFGRGPYMIRSSRIRPVVFRALVDRPVPLIRQAIISAPSLALDFIEGLRTLPRRDGSALPLGEVRAGVTPRLLTRLLSHEDSRVRQRTMLLLGELRRTTALQPEASSQAPAARR